MRDCLVKIREKLGSYGKIIYFSEFGSHLYGTNTKVSDHDYKGIFLPDFKKLILYEHIPNSFQLSTGDNNEKNSKDDIDAQVWSLQYWLSLLLLGDTNAIDLLFSIKSNHQRMVIDPHFEFILNSFNFRDLINLNAKGYIGYSYHQARKYGIKGTKISYLKNLISYLENQTGKIGDILIRIQSFMLLKDEEREWMKYDPDKKVLWILDKGYPMHMLIEEVILRLKKELSKYGNRAELAEKNQGIDWKAISHAMRCLAQIDEIVKTGDLVYPLKDAEYLKEIKAGKRNWNDFKPVFEGFLSRVTKLCEETEFPTKEEVQELHKEIIVKMYEL